MKFFKGLASSTILSLFLLFSASFQAGSAFQCGIQAGGKDYVCPDGRCCSKHGWCGNTEEYCGDGCQSHCKGGGGGGGFNVGDIITEELFEEMLQHRNDRHCLARGFYTYDAFINATHAFPEFGTAGDEASRQREIAAFFGQTSHETTGGWEGLPSDPYIYGYCIVKDPHPGRFDYCDHWDKRYPCAPGRQYYGRGPFLLTWNSNYELAGEFLGLDLINKPDLVATDSNIAFETAIWFWMTPFQGKPSPHEVMIGAWEPSDYDRRAGRLPGYGLTTNIINGGLECGKGGRGRDREAIGFYVKYCKMLNVDPGDNLDCSRQVPYDERHRSWATE